MPRISTKTHAAADYATGALLLAAPGLAGVRDARARALLRGVGAAVLGQALVTDWELALIRRLPVRAHLAADAVTGATLLASPPLLRLGARGTGAWLPLAVVGLAEGALAALTRPEASGAEGAGGARAGQGLHQARVPGAPDDQPDHRPRAVPTDRLPDADREAGLKPTLAAAPVEAPGPSVPAPGGGPGSTTERMERIDATTPDAESLGVRDQDPLDQLAAREEAAAAAEAAGIGGDAPTAGVPDDPAMAPVYEAGGGEEEGFEQAEELLVENASHDVGGGDPLRDALDPEAESDRSAVEYAEADGLPSTSSATPADDPDDDPGAQARRGVE